MFYFGFLLCQDSSPIMLVSSERASWFGFKVTNFANNSTSLLGIELQWLLALRFGGHFWSLSPKLRIGLCLVQLIPMEESVGKTIRVSLWKPNWLVENPRSKHQKTQPAQCYHIIQVSGSNDSLFLWGCSSLLGSIHPHRNTLEANILGIAIEHEVLQYLLAHSVAVIDSCLHECPFCTRHWMIQVLHMH